jgi:hypothetical protein
MSKSPSNEVLQDAADWAFANSGLLLASARVLAQAPLLRPFGCALLTLAYEEFGKALQWRATVDGLSEYDLRTMAKAPRERARLVRESHEAKQSITTFMIEFEIFSAALGDWIGRSRGKPLEESEWEALRAFMRSHQGELPHIDDTVDVERMKAEAEEIFARLKNLDERLRSISEAKESGFYIDIDADAGLITGPWENTVLDFDWFADLLGRIHKTYSRAFGKPDFRHTSRPFNV